MYRLPNAIKEKIYLFDQLQYLKDERKKITYNMEKYNAEKTEFKEYMREELLKIKVLCKYMFFKYYKYINIILFYYLSDL